MNKSSLDRFEVQSAATGENLWGATIQYLGAQYPAAITDPARARWPLAHGGETEQADLVVRVRKAVMPSAPQRQTDLQWRRTPTDSWSPIWNVETYEDTDTIWIIRCSVKN